MNLSVERQTRPERQIRPVCVAHTFLAGILFLVLSTGCGKQTAPVVRPALQVLNQTGQMTKPTEVLSTEEALTDSDVVQLLRFGMTSNEALLQVKRRGLVVAIEDPLEGASPELQAALKNSAYVLTDNAKRAYDTRARKRSGLDQQSRLNGQRNTTSHDPDRAARQEQERMSDLQKKSIQIAKQTERKEEARADRMSARSDKEWSRRDDKNRRSGGRILILR